MLAYSSSKGCIRLADMRSAALCDRHSKAFEEVESQVCAFADQLEQEDGRIRGKNRFAAPPDQLEQEEGGVGGRTVRC